MRKELLLILTGIIILSAVLWWHYDSSVDVKITGINAPRTLGVDTIRTDSMNEIELVIQNNESKPVKITIETENAFVDEKGNSVDTYIVFGYNGYTYSDYISTRDEITLEPGENRLAMLLGYQVTGKQEVHIKIVNNEVVLDEKSFTVDVMPPELSIELNYDVADDGQLEICKINACVLNSGLGRAENAEATLSIIDPETNDTVASETRYLTVPAYSKSPFSTWQDAPAAIIELSSGKNSAEKYTPVQAVARGKNGDQYIVKLAVTWRGQVSEKQITVPEYSETGEEL